MAKVSGVTKVLLADNEAFKGFLPGKLDNICLQCSAYLILNFFIQAAAI